MSFQEVKSPPENLFAVGKQTEGNVRKKDDTADIPPEFRTGN